MIRSIWGLSLTELLFALTIISVLAVTALPAWQPLLGREQGRQVITELAGLLNAARTTAIRESTRVTICPAAPESLQCGGPWQQGAIAFQDRDGTRRAAASRLIHRLHWPDVRGTLRWRAFGNRQYLIINSRGQIRHQSGNFTWCPLSGIDDQARQLVINAAGRIRRARDSDGDGIRENSGGQPLDCS